MKTRIIELRKDGKSYNEISKILNCSKGTISYYCKNIDSNIELSQKNRDRKNINQIKNIPILTFGKEVTEEMIKDVIFYRNKGYTYEKINEKLNLSLDKIKKICKIKGINNQNKYQNKYQKFSFTEEEISKMQIFYDKCKSIRKVANEFKLSKYTVSKYIKTNKKNDKLSLEALRKNKSQSVVDWRKRAKIKLVEYKGGCCEVCGYEKSIGALSFHHKDPEQKDFNISAKSYAFERLKKEVDKCILVCANCHIEIHEHEK
jgi:DNA-binding CsgD family transcriptional regulator